MDVLVAPLVRVGHIAQVALWCLGIGENSIHSAWREDGSKHRRGWLAYALF